MILMKLTWTSISKEDKARIYLSWTHSIIIKVVGKKVSHQYLKKKLTKLWKPTEGLIVMILDGIFSLVSLINKKTGRKL